MISEPLLWHFLGSLVFIGITPFSTSLLPSQQPPQPLVVEPPKFSSCRAWGSRPPAAIVVVFHTAKTTTLCLTTTYIAPINFPQVPLISSYADLHTYGNLKAIRDFMHPHAPLKGSASQLTCPTWHSTSGLYLRVLPRVLSSDHVPARTLTRLLTSFYHVNPSCIIADVACISHWHHHLTSSSGLLTFSCLTADFQ